MNDIDNAYDHGYEAGLAEGRKELAAVASEIERLEEMACGLDALQMWRNCFKIAHQATLPQKGE